MTFGVDCGRQTVMIIQEVADMKIAVCIKQVPDTDDVKIDRKTGTLKRSEVSGILNPEDMSAVRMAAALRREMEKKGEKSSLTAITMGPPAASEVLREAMACGADEGILLCDRAFAGGGEKSGRFLRHIYRKTDHGR